MVHLRRRLRRGARDVTRSTCAAWSSRVTTESAPFKAVLCRSELTDPVLGALARTVHEADREDERYDAPEAPGVDALTGVCRLCAPTTSARAQRVVYDVPQARRVAIRRATSARSGCRSGCGPTTVSCPMPCGAGRRSRPRGRRVLCVEGLPFETGGDARILDGVSFALAGGELSRRHGRERQWQDDGAQVPE